MKSRLPDLRLPTKDVYGLKVPILDNPYTQILRAIEQGGTLEMFGWHTEKFGSDGVPHLACGTVHCIGGWTTHLCGAQGFALETKVGCDDAADMILCASSRLPVPSFDPEDYEADGWDDDDDLGNTVNKDALATIRNLAAQEAAHG